MVITGGAEKPSRRPKTRKVKKGEEESQQGQQGHQGQQGQQGHQGQQGQQGQEAKHVKRVTLHRGGSQIQPAELKATEPASVAVNVQGRLNSTPLQQSGSLPATALSPAYVTLHATQAQQTQAAQTQAAQTQAAQTQAAQTQAAQGGGVVLKPRKTRVTLQPHKPKEPKNTTRKVRRVIIHTKQMVHGMTRVNNAHKDASTASIDFIKKFLIDRGIIQPSSKAPSSMLRSMYADCNIIRDGKAL